jgi:hypothetical protein
VRARLVGKWKKDPRGCCLQLEIYLGSLDKTPTEKLRIVMNYLTGSGFRMGKIKHDCIDNLRGKISAELKKRKFQSREG